MKSLKFSKRKLMAEAEREKLYRELGLELPLQSLGWVERGEGNDPSDFGNEREDSEEFRG